MSVTRITILIPAFLLLMVSSNCNKAFNLSKPDYEGWDELILIEGKAPIRPERAKLFFNVNEIPVEFDRIVLITAPLKVNQVTASDWEKARHYAAYHGANGVFLQGNTAAYRRFSPPDSVQTILGPRFQNRIERNMANFFGIKY